jgi:hypothetical protein
MINFVGRFLAEFEAQLVGPAAQLDSSVALNDPIRLTSLLSTSIPKLNITGRWQIFKRLEEMTGMVLV